jgi:hypothetical protein
MVNATPQPLYPRERPGTHFVGGRVGSRAGLDVWGKSRLPRDPTWDGPSCSKSLSRPTSILCNDNNYSLIHSMVLSEASDLWVQTCEFDYTQSVSGSILGLCSTINFETTVKHKYMKLPINTLYPVHN